jgi:hypothetical protein
VNHLAAIDPGLSKCGLVLADTETLQVKAAGVLPPERCQALLLEWAQSPGCTTVLLGDGTGSRPWQQWLRTHQLRVQLIPEAGTTLAARERYWQLEPARGWRRWLPHGLRLPPRDVDDVVAQLLIERQLGQALNRSRDLELLSRSIAL